VSPFEDSQSRFGAAGYYGGGDGGISIYSTTGGGGGAGSSFWIPSATNTSMSTDTTGTPSVTISYSHPLTIAANPRR